VGNNALFSRTLEALMVRVMTNQSDSFHSPRTDDRAFDVEMAITHKTQVLVLHDH